jgi:hypothetical protein
MESTRPKRHEVWIKVGIFFCFGSFFLVLLSKNIADPDLWGYMAFGRLFWQSNAFPYQDVFSYVPTLHPWVYHEWLTGVLFLPLYQTLGGSGLQVLKYVLALSTIGLVYLTARMRGAHPLAAALFLAIVTSASRFGYPPVRAQIFTFFFFALSLYVLERARLHGRWRPLFLLPLIQIPWCNLHGGFLAGLGLIAIYAVGEFLARRPFLPYLWIFLLSVLVTLINPYGVEYWIYLGRAVTMPRPNIIEWGSVFQAVQSGVTNVWLLVFLLGLSLIMLFGMFQARWREVTAGLALAVTFVLGLKHIRHLTLFFILAGAYWPVCLKANVDYLQSNPRLNRLWRSRNLKISVFALLVILALMNFSLFIMRSPFSLRLPDKPAPPEDLNAAYYPLNAVDFIKKQGLSGKILTRFDWGEYLIWELSPPSLVAFDGRYETVYPPEVEQKYAEFHFGLPQWRQFLEDYPPDLILWDKRMKIVQLLKEDPEWRQIYGDSSCVLFLPANRKLQGLREK